MKQVEKQASPKKGIRAFWEDETGEFGIKQIAATVAVIVIIGIIVGIVRGQLPTWVSDIWDYFMELIEGMTGGSA
ncbi:hypothetical protein [Paenibacillus macerans]|uniref:hypothetical protein n=1 Tax=Paenibacillus macerans TaxID=44252 RepID=UPI00203C3E61|nr:hypothetical protein [Paenibacillus macerans]MCM3703728.1 hypothetical protein [Paenibacillus macerans]